MLDQKHSLVAEFKGNVLVCKGAVHFRKCFELCLDVDLVFWVKEDAQDFFTIKLHTSTFSGDLSWVDKILNK